MLAGLEWGEAGCQGGRPALRGRNSDKVAVGRKEQIQTATEERLPWVECRKDSAQSFNSASILRCRAGKATTFIELKRQIGHRGRHRELEWNALFGLGSSAQLTIS